MECQEIKYKLQELVDGSLEKDEAAAVRKHLKVCRDCATDYRLLALTAQAIRSLPLAGPGPLFNARIMDSLGLDYLPSRIRPAAKWLLGTALGLSSLWIAVLGLGLHLGLIRTDPGRIYSLAKSTVGLLADLQVIVIRAGLRLADLFGLAGKIFSTLLSGSNLPVQAAISAAISLGLMVLISRKIHQPSNI